MPLYFHQKMWELLMSGMHDDLNLPHLLARSQNISGCLCRQPASKRSLL